MPARVLTVGHCAYDHGNLSRLLRDHFQAEAVPVAGLAEALRRLQDESFALVLVNRIFDETGEAGLEFIRQARAMPQGQATPIMLVSNYPDWQAQAVSLGATPGFGKDSLRAAATLAVLRPHLQPEKA